MGYSLFVFYSTKFSSKIKYVNSLQELGGIIPMEYVNIPASIVRWVWLCSSMSNTASKAVQNKQNIAEW